MGHGTADMAKKGPSKLLQEFLFLPLNFCFQSGRIDRFKLPLALQLCLAAKLLGLNWVLIDQIYPRILCD